LAVFVPTYVVVHGSLRIRFISLARWRKKTFYGVVDHRRQIAGLPDGGATLARRKSELKPRLHEQQKNGSGLKKTDQFF
jgi:hypothetical protein